MKKYLYFSIAALALASCSNDEFLGTGTGQGPSASKSDAIGFGGETLRPTRADFTGSDAADKLNNNFIVYGFKTSAAEEADGTVDAPVFDLYNVNYTEGTAYTTESNTANWEYVGLNSAAATPELQTIKYWDLSAKSYVFSAVSGTGITATKTLTGSTVYDKGWTVEIPAGGSLSDLYASDRVVVAPADYKQTVNLTFRALGTKIRFAMYETVPGYSVKIDRFYYKDNNDPWAIDETNFAINGAFKTANATTTTPLTVTYYDDNSGIENRPKVTFTNSQVTESTYGAFGANIQATEALGTTSTEATYDQAGKEYTMILPFESTGALELYVDYTLTSTDNAKEKIKVKHASAKVPVNYAQWKPNFAYTYIFKISDNTNGTTGELPDPTDPSDPNDPTVPIDPETVGLFPITFDAVVITDEEDVQETITTVAEPSITTYAQGIVVTKNDEYVEGDVYFTVMENGALADLVNHGEVFEVKNYGTIETEITEEIVANWKNNFCVLLPVPTTTSVTAVPLTNGTELEFAAGKLGVFGAKAGKTYAIHYNTTDTWKVVKVAGDEAAAVTYTQTMPTATISAADGEAVYQVVASSPVASTMVIGANANVQIYNGTENVTTNFTITDNYNGTYQIGLTTASIAAGANGTYTVKFNGDGDQTFTVSLSYALTSSPVTVVTDGTTATFTLTDGTNAISKAVIANLPTGVTITETATAGTYEVVATSEAAPGSYTTVTVAGQALTINVDSYAFVDSRTFTLDYAGNAPQQTLYLTKNVSEYADVEVSAMTGIDENVAKIIKAGAGIYAVVPMGFGSYTVKYENASAVITVYQYAMNNATVKKSTGKATLEVSLNNGSYNALTSGLKIFDSSDNDVTSNFTVSTNGKNIVLSNVKSTLAAGTYTAKYTVSSTVVAQSSITVTE